MSYLEKFIPKVEEYEGIFYRHFTVQERRSLLRKFKDASSDFEQSMSYIEEVLFLGLADENGNRLFNSEADRERLQSFPAELMDRVAKEICLKNGLLKKEDSEPKKE